MDIHYETETSNLIVFQIELSDAGGPTILERMTFTYGLGERHGLFEEIKRAQGETE